VDDLENIDGLSGIAFEGIRPWPRRSCLLPLQSLSLPRSRLARSSRWQFIRT